MLQTVLVPDIGAYKDVDIIEILVAVGDSIEIDASLITLETDKATLEVPSPYKGVIKSIEVKVGDKVSEGSAILTLEVEGAAPVAPVSTSETKAEPKVETKAETKETKTETKAETKTEIKAETKKEVEKSAGKETEKEIEGLSAKDTGKGVHAGPGVRRFARELGVDLSFVPGSGPKNRILKTDIQAYVKKALAKVQSGSAEMGGAGSGSSGAGLSGLTLAPWPQTDPAKFGPVTVEPLSRIKKLSGSYLHRNWVMVPHVTQFDEADITDLENFRQEQKKLAEAEGIKLTPLVFIMKALVAALKQFPTFNASLDAKGTELTLKQYYHIGVAVDTPNGLVVPVVRDVDQKGLFDLAKELGEISQKARKGQLAAVDMQGSSFSISSLGGIGGTAFTPIINVPDVAILGVSKSQMKQIYVQGEFQPRLMLPLSLSYDHRVIDGAEAARFSAYLVSQLSEIRLLLL